MRLSSGLHIGAQAAKDGQLFRRRRGEEAVAQPVVLSGLVDSLAELVKARHHYVLPPLSVEPYQGDATNFHVESYGFFLCCWLFFILCCYFPFPLR